MVPAEMPSYWLVYFNVADVDASFRTVLDAGGHEMMPPTDFPGGRFAIVSDPQGAAFGLLRTTAAVGARAPPLAARPAADVVGLGHRLGGRVVRGVAHVRLDRVEPGVAAHDQLVVQLVPRGAVQIQTNRSSRP